MMITLNKMDENLQNRINAFEKVVLQELKELKKLKKQELEEQRKSLRERNEENYSARTITISWKTLALLAVILFPLYWIPRYLNKK